MFSRNVSFKLKPRSTAEFTRILEGKSFLCSEDKGDLRMRSVSSPRNVTRQSPSACGIRKKTPRLIIVGSILRS